MMNKIEYLMTVLSEECAEVAELCSKVNRFGIDNIAPDETLSNRKRLINELNDIYGVVALLMEEQILPEKCINGALVQTKKKKVDSYYKEYKKEEEEWSGGIISRSF